MFGKFQKMQKKCKKNAIFLIIFIDKYCAFLYTIYEDNKKGVREMDLCYILDLPAERFVADKIVIEQIFGAYTWDLLWNEILRKVQQANTNHYKK